MPKRMGRLDVEVEGDSAQREEPRRRRERKSTSKKANGFEILKCIGSSDWILNFLLLLHLHPCIVLRSSGARVFVHEDPARAAARSSWADDCRPGSTNALDRHDGVHDGKVSLVDGDFSIVKRDRVLFLDHSQIERRLVAAITNLAAATSTRVLEDGEFLVVLLDSDRGKVAQQQRDPVANALFGIVGDVFHHPRHPALLTTEAQALLKCVHSIFPIDMGKEERGPFAIEVMQVLKPFLQVDVELLDL